MPAPHPALRWLLVALVPAFFVVAVLAIQAQSAIDDVERGLLTDPGEVTAAYDTAERLDFVVNVVTIVAVAAGVLTAAWVRRSGAAVPRIPLVVAVAGVLLVRGSNFSAICGALLLAVAAALTLRYLRSSTRAVGG